MALVTQTDDEKISMVMAMGFSDIEIVSNALKACSGDISEAVYMLTENTLATYTTKDDLSKVPDDPWCITTEFPVAMARTLHNRVFAESWNIPYKKEEALGQCILAATTLAKSGQCESDVGCRRFLEELLPECFNKLMDTVAVRRWTDDVQQGILRMSELLIDLAVTVLQCTTVTPMQGILVSLTEVFHYTNEFHEKHKTKRSEYQTETEYATYSEFDHYYGWLIDLLNMFGAKGGFDALIQRLQIVDIPLPEIANLMRPLSVCAGFLSRTVVWPSLKPILQRVVDKLSNLTEQELKRPDADRCFQIVEFCQHICNALFQTELKRVTNIRFHLIYAMIKLPHFSARINALKGLGKLISDSDRGKSEFFDNDFVQNWMTEKRVLYYALDGKF